MSLFDLTQKAVFQIATKVFGDTAIWGDQTAQVLFKCPTDPVLIGDKYEYRPYVYSFEYIGLEGLKESVDKGTEEHVTVNGISLAIREVQTKFDGKTYIAFGERD